MTASYLLTEENLIGGIADAILQLKKIKEGRNTLNDASFFIKLIEFLEKANTDQYQDLLYDKYFIVSEDFLGSLHQEFKQTQGTSKIDFTDFRSNLNEIANLPNKEAIDMSMTKLKEIGMLLLQIKNQGKN